MAANGHFIWNELATRDVEQAKKFYADTVGWTYSSMPMVPEGEYTVAMDGEVPVAGIMPMVEEHFEGVPEHWMAYICVNDLEARVKKAVAAGATVLQEPFDVPEVGRIAMLRQPGGAVIGWMTPVEGVET